VQLDLTVTADAEMAVVGIVRSNCFSRANPFDIAHVVGVLTPQVARVLGSSKSVISERR